MQTNAVDGHSLDPRKMHLVLGIQDCWQSQSGSCFEQHRGKHRGMSLYQNDGDVLKVFELAL